MYRIIDTRKFIGYLRFNDSLDEGRKEEAYMKMFSKRSKSSKQQYTSLNHKLQSGNAAASMTSVDSTTTIGDTKTIQKIYPSLNEELNSCSNVELLTNTDSASTLQRPCNDQTCTNSVIVTEHQTVSGIIKMNCNIYLIFMTVCKIEVPK